MNEKTKPKVILLENDESVSAHTQNILEKEGWDVSCERFSKDALNTLDKAPKNSFALFISNFKLPKMEGDDVLLKVKSISPYTQRMLVVPDDKAETLIKAINKAEIHASIISPFKDENLANQAQNCLTRYKDAIKQARLKRVTNHQNKQMFNIAKKLKKKSNTYKKLINEKNDKKIKLKSKIRKLKAQAQLDSDITLEYFLEHKKITPSQETYQKEFSSLYNDLKTMFELWASQYKIESLMPDLKTILETIPPKDETTADETPPDEAFKETEPDTAEQMPADKEPADTDTVKAPEDETADKIQTEDDRGGNLVLDILSAALKQGVGTSKEALDVPEGIKEEQETEPEQTLEDYFKISISDDLTKVWAKKIKPPDDKCPPHSLTDILDLLLKKEVSYGILEDEAIEKWLSDDSEQKILISEGEAPVPGKNGSIKFSFQIDFTNPGKINEDGSIDFRERGDIPYAKTGDLLAKKTMAREGKTGISVSGLPIPVEEVFDPVFEAGNGVKLSEDKTCIHSEIDGQPHCDALGTISVSPELIIPGDVDYETGNIDFNGNIVVKGMIKEGFSVKGINLTVQEIEGGTIDISGDLNVSAGITDSIIHVHGNTQAKFINNSKVMGFGDVTVSKEIIDSSITLSGCCINSTGHIISSRISAKLGIEGGSIGTNSSTPVKLIVGIEEHLKQLNKQIDEDLEASIEKAGIVKDKIQKLEDQDQALYEKISEEAHIQDRAQVGIKQIKKELPEIENSNDLTKLHEASNTIKKLKEKALNAEKELNTIFKTQDKIAKDIEELKEQVQRYEKKNKAFVIQKKALKEYSMKEPAKASVSIAKTITQGSSIKGPGSSMFLSENKSRCKILEIISEEEGTMISEMQITDL